ncbi:MAG: DNA primase [Candidatus Woykebacteria bacterium RBG_13_40_7b]|uniref:DNA primase n=1 Tax=Candidatus Woykebacteria bacterium RBG_13_40_7b TaxID=1802594 RepID=A0A1G1WAC1_9BACT|nr:MAG: DNA primase [Candidatus Woykebacteria bacterium RBG_13_40_7b]
MDEVEEIKRRIDIVDLISSYLTLKKAGANYRALCPFHNEKTPSLMVSPEKQIFKCFGCNEGGDVFSFVMKMENLEFRETLEMLAQRAGVKLKPRRNIPPDEKPDKKSRLFKINLLSAQVFHKILISHSSGKSALSYLQKRKISSSTIKDFMIGYAPQNKVLAPFLKKRGFTDQEIQSAGGPDRFFRRLIFPIRDVMGNVLGFTGRVLDPKQEPKYLNTPETIIFHKGRILFNLEKARGEIKVQKATVVVEGQMDVIASYQAGVKNVVATSGTALTKEHLQTLYRYTPNIIFSFDSDNAGLQTAKKAYESAIAEGLNVKMVDLENYKDPGEMIADNPKKWQKAVENAKSVIDWYFNLAFEDRKSKVEDGEMTSQEKKEIAKEILPIIKKIPDTIEQAHFIGLLAKKLGVAEQVVFDALGRLQKGEEAIKTEKTSRPQLLAEEIFVGILAKNPGKIKNFINKILPEDFKLKFSQKVYSLIFSWYNQRVSEEIRKYLSKKLSADDFKRLELIGLEIEQKYPLESNQVLIDLYRRIKSDKSEEMKEKYAQEISQAEKEGNMVKLKQLIKEFQDVISK